MGKIRGSLYAATKPASNLLQLVHGMLFDWQYFGWTMAALLAFEAIVSAVIILKVPYTEIDWKAYMQEVEGVFVQGDFDYLNLRGDTGPLVYPGFFVWFYGLLWKITDNGTNIARAQWIFWGIYLVFQFVVLSVYKKTRPHAPWLAVILCLSKRMHSIFVLRLFNDPVAMLFAHGAVWCFSSHRWLVGSLLYSLGVGMKMNVLLFAPALLLLFLRNTGIWGTFLNLSVCAGVQIIVGAPFLATYPVSYLKKAFELSRVFFYKWTVNFRFLPENIFVSKQLALLLLALHLGVLAVVIASWTWRLVRASEHLAVAATDDDSESKKRSLSGGGRSALSLELAVGKVSPRLPSGPTSALLPQAGGSSSSSSWFGWMLAPSPALSAHSFDALAAASDRGGAAPLAVALRASEADLKSIEKGLCKDSPLFIAALLYASNLVGVAFARTLHYQFYSWYVSSVPLLLGASGAPAYVVVVASGLLELAFLTFPSTSESSIALHLGHLLVLGAVLSADAGSFALPWSWGVPRRLAGDRARAGQDESGSSGGGVGVWLLACIGWIDGVLRGLGAGTGAAWEAGEGQEGWLLRVSGKEHGGEEGGAPEVEGAKAASKGRGPSRSGGRGRQGKAGSRG